MYSVQDLENDLAGILHGTTNNQIQNLSGIINRAARQLLIDVDPQETKRILEFIGPIFNTVVDYPIAPDVKGNAIIDIRPQVRRLPRDIWNQGYNQAFDIAKQNIFNGGDLFTMNFNTGIKTVRINAPYLNAPIIINQADSITDNGTWSLQGDASNLVVDNVNFVAGTGSLEFLYTPLGSPGLVVNNTITPINLTSIQDQGSLFFWVYLSNASLINYVLLFFGSTPDGGNTYTSQWESQNITVNQQGTAFVNGWNLIQVPWSALQVAGSNDASSINAVQLLVSSNSGVTPQVIRFNLVEGILGTILEYEYYSKYLFRDGVTGTFQEKVTDPSNQINLDTETYNLLFNLVAWLAVQQQQGLDAMFYDGNFFGQAYADTLAKYRARYKSELQKPQSSYYRVPQLVIVE